MTTLCSTINWDQVLPDFPRDIRGIVQQYFENDPLCDIVEEIIELLIDETYIEMNPILEANLATAIAESFVKRFGYPPVQTVGYYVGLLIEGKDRQAIKEYQNLREDIIIEIIRDLQLFTGLPDEEVIDLFTFLPLYREIDRYVRDVVMHSDQLLSEIEEAGYFSDIIDRLYSPPEREDWVSYL